MKHIIILFLLIFAAPRYLSAAELTYSGLNGHHYFREEAFANKIDSKGALMYNPILSLTLDNNNFLIGKDSVNSSFIGYYRSFDGLVLGLYTTNIKDWHKAGLYNFKIPLNETYGLIPIIGYELKQCNENFCLKEVITPFTFSLGISVRF